MIAVFTRKGGAEIVDGDKTVCLFCEPTDDAVVLKMAAANEMHAALKSMLFFSSYIRDGAFGTGLQAQADAAVKSVVLALDKAEGRG